MLTFDSSAIGIGLTTRKLRPGPEAQLVAAFIERLHTAFRPRSKCLAIFREPALETGYPDLVVAEYRPAVFGQWSAARSRLIPTDFKILQHLHSVRGTVAEGIETQLGIRSRPLLYSLERLLDAGLISRSAGTWKAVRAASVFGITRLVAIEAKVNDWEEVFAQSSLNRWFASETYALSPVTKPVPSTLKRAGDLGVGILSYTHAEIRELQPSSKSRLPACYASWLFNEWIGRRLNVDS